MNDKPDQIEKMAAILCESKAHNCNGEDCKCIKQATALYNANCRILDKGSKIISNKKLLEIADDYTEMAKFRTKINTKINKIKKQKQILEKALEYFAITYGFTLRRNRCDNEIEYSCNGYVIDEDTVRILVQAKKLIDGE